MSLNDKLCSGMISLRKELGVHQPPYYFYLKEWQNPISIFFFFFLSLEQWLLDFTDFCPVGKKPVGSRLV